MRYLSIPSILLCTCFTANLVFGQAEQKLTASDAAEDDRFGEAVDVYRDVAVIGAFADDDSEVDMGSAYVFANTGGLWLEQQKLIAPDPVRGMAFGSSVAIYRDIVVVGAEGDDEGAIGAGSAYVFRDDDGMWTQEQKLVGPDPEFLDVFGAAVAIDGSIVVVGAPGKYESAGAAYVFRQTNGAWTREQELTASDPADGDQGGSALAIHGDVLLFGAYQKEDSAGVDVGAVYVFRNVDGVWTEEQKLSPSDGTEDIDFGFALDVYADVAVIGARTHGQAGTNAGAVYIFKHADGVWTEEQILEASDAQAFDQFGVSVSVYDDVMLAGALQNDEGDTNTGSVYVFRDVDGVWTEEEQLLASDGLAFDQFGSAVAVYPGVALVGVWHDDHAGTSSGSAYVIGIANPTGTAKEDPGLPSDVALLEAFPNPFRSETVIRFTIPRTLKVRLRVYDLLGREVARLFDGVVPEGTQTLGFTARGLPGGIYVYRLESDSGISSGTLHLVE